MCVAVKTIVLFLFFIFAAGIHFNCGGSGSSHNSSPAPFPSISLSLFAGGFIEPTHINHAGDGSGRIFVVERAGRIRIIKNGTPLSAPFLNIGSKVITTGQEQGLFNVAFPPGYASKGYFYVNYTSAAGGGDTVVARYRVTANPDIADPLSEEVILTVDQPFANHNGGQLGFGPDGFLYIALGDGGSEGDPFNNGQNTATLLGKILRIDTESAVFAGYLIPVSNPFAISEGFRGEIWALGLRNPWRFSVDRLTGDLYIADVGGNQIEEVNFQAAASAGGENYGWNIMEGSQCFLSPGCNSAGLALPVSEYDHSLGGCSITGGFVYRGAEFASMQGIYFFGDFCTGVVRAMKKNVASFTTSILLDTAISISTFGEDEAGNLYAADFTGGAVYKINAAR